MRLKYIVTNHNGFAIFDEGQTHKDVARGLYGIPVGAGFCTIARQADSEEGNVHCFGESVTLKIGSREEDEEIINRAIRGY